MTSPLLISVLATSLGLVCISCADSSGQATKAERLTTRVRGLPVKDVALAPWQTQLLDLAFDSASDFPIDPHIKNRSRSQEAVVVASFELDQPRRALGYIGHIDNWRRGAGYADYAYYSARHGDRSEIEELLGKALAVAAQEKEAEDSQDWRISRIRSKVARVYLLLGRPEDARKVVGTIAGAESYTLDAEWVRTVDADCFDRLLEDFDGVFLKGDFDEVRNTLKTCVLLFDRFYEDEKRRAFVKQRVCGSYERLPRQVRIELLADLAQICIEKKDPKCALELLDEGQRHMDSVAWLPEHQIPLQCRLAVLRFEAGDQKTASHKVAVALARFDAQHERIVDIYRADLLRSIAQARHQMGNDAQAMRLYKRAAKEGQANPNSRPRCDDLVATCCSLAKNRIEPDEELWSMLRAIREGLGEPW